MSKNEYLNLNNNEQSSNIPENGQRVLKIIEENKKKGLIVPDFGDLNDLAEPCVLVVGDEKLEFEKELAIKVLSKVAPGEIVANSGMGMVIQESSNTSIESRVFLYVGSNIDLTKVVFDINSKSLDPNNDFAINQRIELATSRSGDQ